MKHVILIGMMGCGKSTCARLLSKALNRPVLDTDTVIEDRAGRSIAAIFEDAGETVFRDMETEICRELTEKSGLVVATGGGIILRQENVELLRKSGVVFFLNRPAEVIYDTMRRDGRPLAQDGRAAFLQRFSQREPLYRRAAHREICQFSSPKTTVETILTQLHKMEGV